MARIKTSAAAMKRLKEKGVSIKIIKKGEQPIENINAPLKKVAAPLVKRQDTTTEKTRTKELRSWSLEIDSRDFQGYIQTLTITEL